MADLMGNSEVLAPGFPNRISHDYRAERCPLRAHKSTVESLYVQFTDIKLELLSDTAGIRRSGNFQLLCQPLSSLRLSCSTFLFNCSCIASRDFSVFLGQTVLVPI